MKILKHSTINAVFIILMSAIYSFLFIFTSNHIEFMRLLNKPKALESVFWNGWSEFVTTGKMKYIGYIIIALTLIILLLILIKRTKKYDEYQISILFKSLIVTGLISILMTPIIVILILSDPSYTIETIFLFASVQWISVLITDMVYVIKYYL